MKIVAVVHGLAVGQVGALQARPVESCWGTPTPAATIGETGKPARACSIAGSSSLAKASLPNFCVQRLPAADAAGHAPGEGTVDGDFLQAQVEGLLEAPVIGRAAAGVEAEELLVFLAPENGEEVAAGPAAHRLDKAEHGIGRNDRVDRIAAGLENVDARHARQRHGGADHAVLRDYRRAVLVSLGQETAVQRWGARPRGRACEHGGEQGGRPETAEDLQEGASFHRLSCCSLRGLALRRSRGSRGRHRRLWRGLRRMIDGEGGPDLLEHLRLLVDAPDQQSERRPGFVFERDADAAEAEQPFEEIAGVDLGVVVLAADLLAGLGGARPGCPRSWA